MSGAAGLQPANTATAALAKPPATTAKRAQIVYIQAGLPYKPAYGQ
jgi:hypothetical protein